MPKHYRKCGMCSADTITDPNIVIFTATNKIKRSLNYPTEILLMICERHFDDNNLRTHGTSKRLTAGAVPIILTDESLVVTEHSYFPNPTCLLILVRYRRSFESCHRA